MFQELPPAPNFLDANDANLNTYIRPSMSNLTRPSPHDTVYNDECVLSFDTPFTPSGIYINLKTYQSYGLSSLPYDTNATSNTATPTLYAWVLKVKVPRVPTEKESEGKTNPTKMAIGVEGGFKTEDQKYQDKTSIHLVSILPGQSNRTVFQYPNPNQLPSFVSDVIDSIVNHVSSAVEAKRATEWVDEIKVTKYAKDLPLNELIANGTKRVVDISDPSQWACEESGITTGLWLNLSDGYIGSGRKNWDGTGGTGAAKTHYEEVLRTTGQKYPLVVKLGTITPDGTGDVYSYAGDEDDAVLNPHLSQHLKRLGVDVNVLRKTEKSTAELNIELNLNYNFSEVTEEGATLIPLKGINFVGLANLGNTCYFNATMQMLMSLDDVVEHYTPSNPSAGGRAHAESGAALNLLPSKDLRLQMGKLCEGMRTETYVTQSQTLSNDLKRRDLLLKEDIASKIENSGNSKEEPKNVLSENEIVKNQNAEEVFVTPTSLRTLVGAGHPEFSTGKQQDAGEFLTHLLSLFETKAKEIYLDPKEDISSKFRFRTIERTDAGTDGVQYKETDGNSILRLSIPTHQISNRVEYEAYESRTQKEDTSSTPSEFKKRKVEGKNQNAQEKEEEKEKPILPNVNFSDVLNEYSKEDIFDFRQGQAKRTNHFGNFPQYLWIQMNRYTYDAAYQPIKLKHTVEPPERLDLSSMRSNGLQENETAMQEDSSGGGSGGSGGSNKIEPDATIVQAIVGMGFSENAGKRAALATSNAGSQQATEWIFGHMEDADLNDPIAETSSSSSSTTGSSIDPTLIAQICNMGFSSEQAEFALSQPGNSTSPDAAVMWLFGHQEELPMLMANAASASSKSNEASNIFETFQQEENAKRNSRNGEYQLIGFISHVGKSTGSGHYVCHILKNVNGEMKWVIHNDRKIAVSQNPPKAHGYLYLYAHK